jgi:dimethylsulfoniopropionate demethylase
MSIEYFSTSNRIKETPFTSRNNEAGVKKYSVYNNTLIPTVFKSLKNDYHHLIKHVQLWDVSCQKIIEIKGKQSHNLIKYLFCRDLSNIVPGKAYYSPIVNFEGGLLNDPVVFCLNENHFLISLSDSDLFNWISAINYTMNFKAEVFESDRVTIAIQGPKSVQLMNKIFGQDIDRLKYFTFKNYFFNKDNVLVSKTGFSKQKGYEIIISNNETGIILWDLIIKEGKDLNVRVGCPNMIERVENYLLSYGNEMTNKNFPQDCGLGKFCNLEVDFNFVGKSALLRQRDKGFNKSIYQVKFDLDIFPRPPFFNNLSVLNKGKEDGRVTSVVWSPRYDKYIGFLIANKNIELNLKDYSIHDKVTFDIVAIN